MLGGGEQHALLHQAGGVTDPGDVPAVGFDLKVVEVRAPEDDPGVRWRRHQAQVAAHGGVQADSRSLNGTLNSGLIRHRPIR